MVYILIAVVVVLVLLIMLILLAVKKFRDPIKNKLVTFKESMMWNGVIRSMTIGYIKFMMTAGL